jgi:flavin-binding protein dodecin
MSNSFEVIERVGVSCESIAMAVKTAVEEAHAEKKVAWFEIVEQRGRVNSEGKVEFQIKVKIGRKLN